MNEAYNPGAACQSPGAGAIGFAKEQPQEERGARRRLPDRPGLRRAQLQTEDILRLLGRASAEALPLVALPSSWLWNMAQDGHAAAHCVEACLVLKFALAEYGLPSDVQAVGVQVNNETPVELYDHAPFCKQRRELQRSHDPRGPACPPHDRRDRPAVR